MHTRRAFIKNIGLAIPAFSLAGTFLSSCGKMETIKPNSKKRIGIIGAGISGLHAAYQLSQNGDYEVEILEASDKIGGRIMSVQGFDSTQMIEAGASGYWMNSQTTRLFGQGKSSSNEMDSFFIDHQMYLRPEMEADPDFKQMERSIESIGSSGNSESTSINDQYATLNIPERVRFICDSETELLNGTSLERVSYKLSQNEGLSRMGSSIQRFDNGGSEKAIFYAYRSILSKVTNNIKVTTIDYRGTEILVTDHLQQVRKYDQIVVTVPLAILKLKSGQENAIQFTPELPENKKQAMESLGMDGGYTLLLKLNNRFWKNGAASVHVDGKIKYYEVLDDDNLIVRAVISGKDAEEIIGVKGKSEIKDLIQNDLVNSIGTECQGIIREIKVIDWKNEKNIQGTFSYFKVGASPDARKILAQDVSKKIFFAGEACNVQGNSGTIHGAIESAENVCAAILTQQR